MAERPVTPSISLIQGGGSIAGQLRAQSLDLSAIKDPRERALVQKQLQAVLPAVAVKAGATAAPMTIGPDDLERLVPAAAIAAAGLGPARTPSPPPPVLWEQDGSALLVQVAGVRAQLGDGYVDIVIPVTCDQTGPTEVTVTFVGGSAARPAGGVMTTEDHPRGPEVVVERWPEPLVAFAWATLVGATSALSGAVGVDTSGRALVPAAVTFAPNGLTVVPIGRHAFVQTPVGP